MARARLAELALVAALAAAAPGCPAERVPVAPAPESPPQPAVQVERDVVEPKPEPAREGWLARSTLTAVLDRGVGAFLASLRVEAVLEGGKFVGWRVLRYENEWVDVRPGDVLLSVNGMPIETPPQVQAVWDSLRTAPAITATLRRDGELIEIRFRVGEPAQLDAGAEPAPDADAGAAP